MGWRPVVAVASTIGSMAGLFTPILVAALTRLLSGRADSVFALGVMLGVMFGGPMAGAAGGAFLGAWVGRRLSAAASGAGIARAMGRAGALGAGWSLIATGGLGAAAWAGVGR